MKPIITILIFSFLPLLLFGQTGKLKGLIRELYSGKPLKEVQIRVIPGNLDFTTDSTGTFEFDSLEVGEYSVIFTKIGYMQHVIPCVKIEADSCAYLRIIMEKVPPAVKDKLAPQKVKK